MNNSFFSPSWNRLRETLRPCLSPLIDITCLTLIILLPFLAPEYRFIPHPMNLSGFVIALTGLIVMAKTYALFRKHQTTLSQKTSSHLITEGMFSKTRNPMYLGKFLFYLGIGVFAANIFSVLTAFGYVVLIHFLVIPGEERLLYDNFGKHYLGYKKKVRRWL